MKVTEDKREVVKNLLKKNFPLLGILLGSVLLSISLGPYSSWDSQIEFAAASGVVKWGLPYTTFGDMINVPPLGYYIDLIFFKVFGLSYETGIGVMTLFGLGCVFLVFKVGELLYGARTGLFAAALFALTPWQVIMSRVFLVDVQCLFFSLLYLLVGIWAIRKDSHKLLLVSGILFGFALLTKLFAVFMLIPLSLIYIYWRPKNRMRMLEGMLVFFLPAFLLQYLWYDLISGQGLLSLFSHDDFSMYLPAGFVPSLFFSLSFFGDVLGVFFLLGYSFSLLFSFLQRKFFPKILVFDLICFATIAGVVGLNTYLVLGNNMLNPYVNSIKYDYLALPFFCWLAASLAKKCSMFYRRQKFDGKYGKLIFYAAVIGLYLLLISMIVNLMSLNMISKYEWLAFNVAGGYSYSFDVLSPILETSHLWTIQFFAFILIQFSLLWAIRGKLESFLSRSEKNIAYSIKDSSTKK
jgi:4-amino-4-deoxy-L-arabinose transferase-like glycosyltransferase